MHNSAVLGRICSRSYLKGPYDYVFSIFNAKESVGRRWSLISPVSFKTMTSAPPVERILVRGQPPSFLPAFSSLLAAVGSLRSEFLLLLLSSSLSRLSPSLLSVSPPFFPSSLSSSPDLSLLPHRCHAEKGHQSISYQGARVDMGVTFHNSNLTFMSFCRVGVHVYFPCVHTRQATCSCACVCMIKSV